MKRIWTALCALFALTLAASAQSGATVRGRVLGADDNAPLNGANVVIKALRLGAAADAQGRFTLEQVPAGTHVLSISYLGFATGEQPVSVSAGQTLDLGDIRLEAEALVGEEVVISASRRPEKITQAPATINVVSARDIAELPSFNVGELAARTKGVDYVRAGVLGTGLNVRGFNSAFNPKNLQMNDGRLSTLIATGLPFGSLGTVVKEDIDHVEIILGPAAVLYGPNAHNGLVNTITKDPRDHQGTTVVLGAGNQRVLTGRFRSAYALNDKFAFKVTGEYTRGEEFEYMDTVYVVGAAVLKYDELELNREFNALRGEASLYFTPKKNHDLILSYGGSNSNNLAQTNAGRNQIKDWQVHYVQLRYASPRIFAQVYHTWSMTDSTYAINQRTQNYHSFLRNGFSDEEARRRSYREAWLPLPTGGVALNRGALFADASRRLNAEAQYNNQWGSFSLITGAQYQLDIANSRGTYLLDASAPIQVSQIGYYAQTEYKFGKYIKAMAAARADYHQLYGFNFVPKAALIGILKNGSARLTYSQGIAAPTILNLSANIFGGLLLGNGEGFTLSDGSTIAPLKVEKIRTIEAGYKGVFAKRFSVDANAYYNFSRDFLSPSINIANAAAGRLVTKRGDTPIQDIVPGTPEAGSSLVLTYVNFGQVNTYGFDIGFRYVLSRNFDALLNYSYFGYQLDTEDPLNDGNGDGKVTPADLPINAPRQKLGFGLNARGGAWFANTFVRWVEAYDFFSGINVSAATNEELVYNGSPVVEGARVGRAFNYGPLGGFVNVDVAAGYKFKDYATLSAQVTNLFGSEVREFVASPAIGRLFSVELKLHLPAGN